MARTVDACAGLARSLTRLVWWVTVMVVIVWTAVRMFLDGDLTGLVGVLTALRPG